MDGQGIATADHRWLSTVHRQQRATAPVATGPAMTGRDGKAVEATIQLDGAAQALTVTFEGKGHGTILVRQEVCRIAGWAQGREVPHRRPGVSLVNIPGFAYAAGLNRMSVLRYRL